jgi:WD40 repeat protein
MADSLDVAWSQPQGGFTDDRRAGEFSPDGKYLATCDRENTLKLWDVVSRREVASTKSATDWFQSVRCSPDGKWLAAGSRDATIQVWDLAQVVATRRFRW